MIKQLKDNLNYFSKRGYEKLSSISETLVKDYQRKWLEIFEILYSSFVQNNSRTDNKIIAKTSGHKKTKFDSLIIH